MTILYPDPIKCTCQAPDPTVSNTLLYYKQGSVNWADQPVQIQKISVEKEDGYHPSRGMDIKKGVPLYSNLC